jgi:hypothetical protein
LVLKDGGNVKMTLHAVVRVGSIEIPYLRAGQGPPVLLIATGTAAAIAADPLFTRLSREFRVVAPVLTDPAASKFAPLDSFSLSLGDLLEGLGIERPLLVADRKWQFLLPAVLVADDPEFAAVVIYGAEDKNAPPDEVVQLLQEAVERPPENS